MEDYYKILGVNENANDVEIKKAFRKLSLKYHPDKPTGDENMFKQINEAYQTLSDSEKRKEYNFKRQFGGGRGPNPFMNGGGPENLFKMFFGGGNNGMPFHHFMQQNMNGNTRIFVDGRPVNMMNRAIPIIKSIEINIKQAFTGCSIPLEIERWIKEDNSMKRTEKETLYIDIPKGVDNGEIIILREKGNIINDNNKGDVKIHIKVINNTNFIRKGLDLIIKKTISLKEALTGFTFELEYINGKVFNINNDEGGKIITPGYSKVVPNMGMERGNNKGSLVIQLNIEFPKSLSKEQIKIIKETL